MGLFGGILGGLVGFATGGPVGAAVGAASGFSSGNSASRTSQTWGSQSGTATRETQMRPWTDQEQSLLDQAYAGLQGELKPTGAADEEAQRKQIYESIFGPQQEAISSAYATAKNQDYANRASRGAANSYAADVMGQKLTSGEARDTAAAAGSATMSAEQVIQARREQARARIATYLQTITQLWNQRISESKVVTTSSGGTSSTAVAPDTFLPSVFAGLGNAVTDETSYLNTNILNKSTGNYLWDAGMQGPVQ